LMILIDAPPAKVVEMLEAMQLLVKTELFVVILAIDARYVTLCLEDSYKGILDAEGGSKPTGLDYLEKLIQISYRAPPVSAEDAMESYLNNQVDKMDRASRIEKMDREKDNWKKVRAGVRPPSKANHRKSMKLYETQKFTEDEVEVLRNSCLAVATNPRTIKRIVNSYKIMKIVWHRQERHVSEEKRHAYLLLLVLCASSTLRKPMHGVLSELELETKPPGESNLAELVASHLGGYAGERCKECIVFYLEEINWGNNMMEWQSMKKDFRLLRSFVFVGERFEVSQKQFEVDDPDTTNFTSSATKDAAVRLFESRRRFLDAKKIFEVDDPDM